jgi:hypothetical protein
MGITNYTTVQQESHSNGNYILTAIMLQYELYYIPTGITDQWESHFHMNYTHFQKNYILTEIIFQWEPRTAL